MAQVITAVKAFRFGGRLYKPGDQVDGRVIKQHSARHLIARGYAVAGDGDGPSDGGRTSSPTPQAKRRRRPKRADRPEPEAAAEPEPEEVEPESGADEAETTG